MQNVFEGSTGEISDLKAKGLSYESVVKNLTEVIWSIDLSVEPYEIIYLNNPLTRTPDGTYKNAPRTIEEWQTMIHPEDQERILDEVVNVLNNGFGSYPTGHSEVKIITDLSAIGSKYFIRTKNQCDSLALPSTLMT